MGSSRRVAKAALLLAAIFGLLLAAVGLHRSVEVWHVVPESAAGQDQGP